jgi:hypothetical protein
MGWLQKSRECSHFVASPKRKIPEVPVKSALPGQKDSRNHYSHSMQLNAFCLETVLPSLCIDSDSTDYSYDSSYTARFYHLFITLIKSRSDCGLLRWNNYISSFRLSQFI